MGGAGGGGRLKVGMWGVGVGDMGLTQRWCHHHQLSGDTLGPGGLPPLTVFSP